MGFRIRLRDKDCLHREEESFNLMLESVAPRLECARSECRKALETVAEILADGAGIPAHSKEKLARARMHLDALWQNVGYFHTRGEADLHEEVNVTAGLEECGLKRLPKSDNGCGFPF